MNSNQKVVQSMLAPKKVQLFCKGVQFISKTLAAKLTIKLFYMPIRFKRPERELAMWESSQKKRIKIKAINKEINVLSYGYSPKKVLLVHGWSGRGTQFFMLANKLLENGYMVVTFDAPAHLKSEGKTTSMVEFIACVHQLNIDFNGFDFAIGHSLGGMSLYNAISEGFSVKKLVTIGSGDLISDIIKHFVKALALKPIIATKMKKYIDASFGYDIDRHSSSKMVKNINIPALIVHDKQDGDVAVGCAERIHKNFKNSKLLITNGLGHTRILRDEPTLNKIIEFINAE